MSTLFKSYLVFEINRSCDIFKCNHLVKMLIFSGKQIGNKSFVFKQLLYDNCYLSFLEFCIFKVSAHVRSYNWHTRREISRKNNFHIINHTFWQPFVPLEPLDMLQAPRNGEAASPRCRDVCPLHSAACPHPPIAVLIR